MNFCQLSFQINFGFILVYKNVFIFGAKIQMILFAYDKKCDFEFEAKDCKVSW